MWDVSCPSASRMGGDALQTGAGHIFFRPLCFPTTYRRFVLYATFCFCVVSCAAHCSSKSMLHHESVDTRGGESCCVDT